MLAICQIALMSMLALWLIVSMLTYPFLLFLQITMLVYYPTARLIMPDSCPIIVITMPVPWQIALMFILVLWPTALMLIYPFPLFPLITTPDLWPIVLITMLVPWPTLETIMPDIWPTLVMLGPTL